MENLQEEVVPPQRPTGITILALLLGLEGALSLFLAVVGLASITSGGNHPFSVVVLYALVGIACFSIARGLWNLKPWAYWATIALQLIDSIYVLVLYFIALPQDTLGTTVFNLLLPVIILVYLLTSRRVREFFRPYDTIRDKLSSLRRRSN